MEHGKQQMTMAPDQVEFDELMADALDGHCPKAVAVAVSGGRDSMALALLLRAWGERHRIPVTALTVDHGLREEARAEAEQVAQWFDAMGMAHDILTWDGDKPEVGLQEAARQARYDLLRTWCIEQGVDVLCTAHHLEDQAETVLQRLSHGSGLDGLAGIPRQRVQDGVLILRPLLFLPRERLEAVCVDSGQNWIEDPTNASHNYSRGRLRSVMKMLDDEGLTAGRLGRVAYRLSLVRAAMDDWTVQAMEGNIALFPEGQAMIKPRGCTKLPMEIRLRLLDRVLQSVSGQQYPPRFERLEGLHNALWQRDGQARAEFAGRTLGGCLIQPMESGNLLVVREEAAVAPMARLKGRTRLVWDHRFAVSRRDGLDMPDGFFVGALEAEGVCWLRKQAKANKWDGTALEKLPGAVRPAIPAIFYGQGQAKDIYSVPLLGYVDAHKAKTYGIDPDLVFETDHLNSGRLPMST